MRGIYLLVILMFLPQSQMVQADENLKKGLAKAQYMLRQSISEKTALQKQLAELKSEMESKDKELSLANKDLKKANARIDKLKGNIGVWQGEYDELKQRLSETRRKLGEALAYGNTQDERFAIQTDNFELCRENNIKLASINQELVAAYQDKSAMDALKQRDPFFGLKAVEVENLVQDYQYRIEDLNIIINEHLLQEPGEEPSPVQGVSGLERKDAQDLEG
ncbi:MAG: hypothetical protein C9356_05760 [Oleiphilus sp.]|nr:MAG: hypothetical protein C9356_05760 [Oleiphilus sp.]